MSAYDNDPRVQHIDREEFGDKFIVQTGAGPFDDRPAIVDQVPYSERWRAFWRCESFPPKVWPVESAETSDEAIRSLIGDPR